MGLRTKVGLSASDSPEESTLHFKFMEHDYECFFLDIYSGNYSIYWMSNATADEFLEEISSSYMSTTESRVGHVSPDGEWRWIETTEDGLVIRDSTVGPHIEESPFVGVKSETFEASWEESPYSNNTSNEITLKFGPKTDPLAVRRLVMDLLSKMRDIQITTAALVNQMNVLWRLTASEDFEQILINGELDQSLNGEFRLELSKDDLFSVECMETLLRPLLSPDNGCS